MINYVFRPIDKWPRPMTPRRQKSPFAVTLAKTYKLLDRELSHLKVEGEVVIEAALKPHEIRLDGRPRADANKPAHPGVILSFTAKLAGRPAPLRYVCDACAEWEDNLRAIVLTLERLRLVDLYGVTQSGEQYRGWNALPPGGPTIVPTMTVEQAAAWLSRMVDRPGAGERVMAQSNYYRELYRAAAAQFHPDKHGGAIRSEWDTLAEVKRLLDAHHQQGA